MVNTSRRARCPASRISLRDIASRARTVRRALHLLEQEGRILRRRGSGTYAKTSRVHSSLAFNADALYGDAPTAAKEPGTEILQSRAD